jgi:hypothetical protein
MSDEVQVCKVYLLVGADLHGPFTVQETHGMITSGTLVSEPKAAETSLPVGSPAGPASRLPSRRPDVSVPMSSVIVDLVLVLLFITGVVLAMLYGIFFNAARDDRLVGVLGGIGLAVVVCFIKILRKL